MALPFFPYKGWGIGIARRQWRMKGDGAWEIAGALARLCEFPGDRMSDYELIMIMLTFLGLLFKAFEMVNRMNRK